MKKFTITITGTCAGEIPDQWIEFAAASAEVQIIEPEFNDAEWKTAGVETTVKIEENE